MPLHLPSSSPSSSPEATWTTAFHQLGQQIKRHFVLSEPYQQALAYIQGLMSGASRKNGWQVAEEMAYVLVFAPIGTSLEEKVKAFGARWTVEQCFQAPKRYRKPSTTVGLSYSCRCQPTISSFLIRCHFASLRFRTLHIVHQSVCMLAQNVT